jgi:hypothetical protein
MALALIPRREADRLRRKDTVRYHIRSAITPRDRILSDVRYVDARQHIV